MSALDPRLARWLVWLGPFALLALAIGFQTDWGRALRRTPPPETPVAPAPVAAAVMPEFRIEGGLASMAATAERPLFNVTRRPAPVAAAEGSRGVLQRGQFVLTGTLITDGGAVAFLKEASGAGKARSVRKGDSINGMTVAAVEPNRIRFTLGDETEDLELKVAKGPKTTVQPTGAPPEQVAAPAAPAAQAGAAPAGGARTTARGLPRATGAGAAPGSDATENVRASRRAARAAEAQQRSAQGDSAAQGTQPSPQQSWQNTFQNMQRRQR